MDKSDHDFSTFFALIMHYYALSAPLGRPLASRPAQAALREKSSAENNNKFF